MMTSSEYNDYLHKLGLKKPWAKPGRAKYGNLPQVREGVRYDSKAEMNYKGILDLRLAAGEITGYLFHVQLPLIAGDGVVLGYYEPDFIVEFPDGHRELHDVKGGGRQMLTALFKWKARHVLAQYGDPVILIDSKTFQPVPVKPVKPTQPK